MNARALIATVREARPLVADLARLLSLAATVDVALARRVRLDHLPRADVSTEAALWSSPLVEVRTSGSLTLRADVQQVLWAELARAPAALDASWRTLDDARAAARPLLRLEERLTYLGLRGDLAAIDDALGRVVRAMLDEPGRRRNLSAWAARALTRLPPAVRDRELARVLGAAARGWVATPRALVEASPLPESSSLVDRLSRAATDDGPRVPVAIRRVGDVLELGGSPPPPFVTIELSAAAPSIVIDDDRTIPLDLRGVTRIPVTDAEVRLRAADGRRWIVAPIVATPNLDAIARFSVWRRVGYAYLVGPKHAVTSAELLRNQRPEWTEELVFGTETVVARIVALDDDSDLAVLALATPVSTAPLALEPHVRQGDTCQLFLDGARIAGTIASPWPALTIHASIDKPAPLGLPVFRGDRVLGHLRSCPGSDAQWVCSARLVAWWLERGSLPSPPRPDVWVHAQPTNEVPETFTIVAPAAMRARDLILVFHRRTDDLIPIGLYRVETSSPAGTQSSNECRLALALPAASSFAAHQDTIERIASSSPDSDIRDEVAALLPQLFPQVADRIAALFGGITAAPKTRTVRIDLPSPVSTAGLLATTVVEDGGVRRFDGHRFGANEITFTPDREVDLRIEVREVPFALGGPDLIVRTSGLDTQELPQHAVQTTRRFRGSAMSGSVSVTIDGFVLEVQHLPGASPAFALRQAVRFVTELLALADGADPDATFVHVHVPGSGALDLGDAQDRFAAIQAEETVTIAAIDPDADLVELRVAHGVAADDAALELLEQALGLEVVHVYERAAIDPLAWRFGVARARAGREIADLDLDNAYARVEVSATDDRPIRGYVTFYVPPSALDDPTAHSPDLAMLRVRAVDGVATCSLRRPLRGRYAIGAVIEDEGVVLEGTVDEETEPPYNPHDEI